MIVAVIPVAVMQPTTDKVVDVIAVRHRLVAASAAMRVRLVARHGLGMAVGMRRVDSDHVLVDVIPMRVVHVAVVEVVDVILMADCAVAATVAMTMRMWSVVNRMSHGATVQVGPATAKPLTTRTTLPGLGGDRGRRHRGTTGGRVTRAATRPARASVTDGHARRAAPPSRAAPTGRVRMRHESPAGSAAVEFANRAPRTPVLAPIAVRSRSTAHSDVRRRRPTSDRPPSSRHGDASVQPMCNTPASHPDLGLDIPVPDRRASWCAPPMGGHVPPTAKELQ